MAKAGEFLSDEEVREYLSYRDQGLAPPDKFDAVVFDGTQIQRAGYRWATSDERKAGDEAAEDAVKASDAQIKLHERARAEAAKRGQAVPVTGSRVPVASAEPTAQAEAGGRQPARTP